MKKIVKKLKYIKHHTIKTYITYYKKLTEGYDTVIKITDQVIFTDKH